MAIEPFAGDTFLILGSFDGFGFFAETGGTGLLEAISVFTVLFCFKFFYWFLNTDFISYWPMSRSMEVEAGRDLDRLGMPVTLGLLDLEAVSRGCLNPVLILGDESLGFDLGFEPSSFIKWLPNLFF